MTSTLAASYTLCRRLHARHGRSYYLASLILPSDQRRSIHALYGFARFVDDLVDVPLIEAPTIATVQRIRRQLHAGIDRGRSEHPILAATVDTVLRYKLEPQWLDDFLDSMALDLHPRRYATWDELSAYTWGSASVIGLQSTRIVGTAVPFDEAAPYACALGEAFQLTNFIRDYDEDRLRGRVYLPIEEFTRAGASPGQGDSPELRAVIAAACDRARSTYAAAQPGIDLLAEPGRACVGTAFVLYQGILDEIGASGYDVFSRRHRLSMTRRLSIAAAAYAGTVAERLRMPFSREPSKDG